jgi:hypothetical protein
MSVRCDKRNISLELERSKMQEFLRFYNEKSTGDWILEIYHSDVRYWTIKIAYKNTHPKYGETIIDVQSSDIDLVFARAQVEFKEWLLDTVGMY